MIPARIKSAESCCLKSFVAVLLTRSSLSPFPLSALLLSAISGIESVIVEDKLDETIDGDEEGDKLDVKEEDKLDEKTDDDDDEEEEDDTLDKAIEDELAETVCPSETETGGAAAAGCRICKARQSEVSFATC